MFDVSICYHELCVYVHKSSLDGDLKQKGVYNAEQLDTRGGILKGDVEAACSAEDSGFWWRVLMNFVPACGEMRRDTLEMTRCGGDEESIYHALV
jgi:hypothetical protein